VYIYTIDGNELTMKQTLDYSGEVSAVSYSPSGDYLAASGQGRKLCIFETNSYKVTYFNMTANKCDPLITVICFADLITDQNKHKGNFIVNKFFLQKKPLNHGNPQGVRKSLLRVYRVNEMKVICLFTIDKNIVFVVILQTFSGHIDGYHNCFGGFGR